MKLINKFIIYSYSNLIACWLILLTKEYKNPLKCTYPPYRIFGIFSTRDILTTIIIGSFLGYFVNKNIIKGILIEFIIGQFFHLLFNVNSMFLYNFNISDIPNGTGYIPNCVI